MKIFRRIQVADIYKWVQKGTVGLLLETYFVYNYIKTLPFQTNSKHEQKRIWHVSKQ